MNNYMSTKWTTWMQCVNSYNLPKLSQEKSENVNRQTTASEIEAAI